MKNLLVLGTVLLCGALSLVARHDTAATDSSKVQDSPLGPRLGKHLFSPPAGVLLPFIRTYSQAMLGGGTTTGMILPEIQIGDRVVVAPVGDLAYMLMVARHEQAIRSCTWPPWYERVIVIDARCERFGRTEHGLECEDPRR
jgi:hypothetical protein